MTHDEAMAAGLAQVIREYRNPPPGGALVPRLWVEENLPSHLRGGWIEDIVTGNCVPVLPARNVMRRLFRRS